MSTRKASKMPVRRKVELFLIAIPTMLIIGIIGKMLLAKAPPPPAGNLETSPAVSSADRFDANAKSGEAFGRAMGHMIGQLGKSYPTTAEIESMAKTAAVDAGSTINDFIFTGAFKRAFANGYREGRNSR